MKFQLTESYTFSKSILTIRKGLLDFLAKWATSLTATTPSTKILLIRKSKGNPIG